MCIFSFAEVEVEMALALPLRADEASRWKLRWQEMCGRCWLSPSRSVLLMLILPNVPLIDASNCWSSNYCGGHRTTISHYSKRLYWLTEMMKKFQSREKCFCRIVAVFFLRLCIQLN